MNELDNYVATHGKFKNIIWEGRFQPIHLGHLAYIRRLLCYGERIWICVVANEQSIDVVPSIDDLPVPEFTKEVDPHHRSEKNILPFWLRYRLVFETISNEFGGAPIIVIGGRRLDLDWPLYTKLFPPNRVFLTPERDTFEDAKARAWKKLGETCWRVDVSDLPKISGTLIRDRISSGDQLDNVLSSHTIALLSEEGYINHLKEL